MLSSFSLIFLVLPIHQCIGRGAPGYHEERTKNIAQDSINGSISAFGSKLIQGLAKDSGERDNVIASPLSAYLALSLLHLGARKGTRATLNSVLEISESGDSEALYKNLKGVIQTVVKEPSDDPSNPLPGIILQNGLFVDRRFSTDYKYIQRLTNFYGKNATAVSVNFRNNINATDYINSRISENTKGRIKNFFSQPLPTSTSAILTSALYFKATFRHPFNKTAMGQFKAHDGMKEVSMMSAKNYVPYYNNTDLQFHSIELLYEGWEYALMIILPHSSQTIGNLTKHIHSLDMTQYKKELQTIAVDYKIPKMKIFSKKSLSKALPLMDAFDELDLSNMIRGSRQLYIHDVWQAAEIEVNEYGTTATAATVDDIEFKASTLYDSEVTFNADQPFIIHIVHKATYIPLFSGVIRNPVQQLETDDSSTRKPQPTRGYVPKVTTSRPPGKKNYWFTVQNRPVKEKKEPAVTSSTPNPLIRPLFPDE